MSQRLPISKKLRFETLKRDGFCCCYCGRRPPQTTLEIDHIVPLNLGGSNEIKNLITACLDCNRGKGATALNSVTVCTIMDYLFAQEYCARPDWASGIETYAQILGSDETLCAAVTASMNGPEGNENSLFSYFSNICEEKIRGLAQ